MLINDMPGYGKVALAAMVPILSRMGYYTYQMPTALVSNTLDYGKFYIEDTTEYMKKTWAVWQELGFEVDCICTGFVTSVEQAELIAEYIKKRRTGSGGNCLVMVDPIMGDGGHLYNGIGEERVAAMRKLIAQSDVMVPNLTEAQYLTGLYIGKEKCTQKEIRALIDGLKEVSGKSVVITSTEEESGGRHLVCGYDSLRGEYIEIPYEYVPVRVPGSGDIFSAVMTGRLLAGVSLQESVESAVRILTKLIADNQGHLTGYKGILLEKYWDVFEAELG